MMIIFPFCAGCGLRSDFVVLSSTSLPILRWSYASASSTENASSAVFLMEIVTGSISVLSMKRNADARLTHSLFPKLLFCGWYLYAPPRNIHNLLLTFYWHCSSPRSLSLDWSDYWAFLTCPQRECGSLLSLPFLLRKSFCFGWPVWWPPLHLVVPPCFRWVKEWRCDSVFRGRFYCLPWS